MPGIQRIYMRRSGTTNSRQAEGPRRVSRLFKQLDIEAQKAIKQAVLTSAEIIRDDARARAPKKTGRLAAAIDIRSRKGGFSREVGVFKSSGVEYHNAIEFGTRNSKAQPYLLPAVEAKKEEVRDLIDGAIAEALEKATK